MIAVDSQRGIVRAYSCMIFNTTDWQLDPSLSMRFSSFGWYRSCLHRTAQGFLSLQCSHMVGLEDLFTWCTFHKVMAVAMNLWRGTTKTSRAKLPAPRLKLSFLILCICASLVPVIYVQYHKISYFLRPLWDTPPKPFHVHFAHLHLSFHSLTYSSFDVDPEQLVSASTLGWFASGRMEMITLQNPWL